jgi:hypothetical protein
MEQNFIDIKGYEGFSKINPSRVIIGIDRQTTKNGWSFKKI